MIAAYYLSGHACGGRFFEQAPKDIFCAECGSCIRDDYLPTDIKLQNKLDISYTYDGRMVASKRVCDLIAYCGYSDIDLIPVTSDKAFFLLNPRNILEIDEFASGVEHGKLCSLCQSSIETIHRSENLVLKNIFNPIHEGMFRTDILFGNRAGKTPIYLIGVNTRVLFGKAHLRGAIFHPVFAQRAKPLKGYNA